MDRGEKSGIKSKIFERIWFEDTCTSLLMDNNLSNQFMRNSCIHLKHMTNRVGNKFFSDYKINIKLK